MPESFQNNGDGVATIRIFAANGDDALQVCRVQQAALVGFARRAVRQHDVARLLLDACRVCAETIDVPLTNILEYRAAHGDMIVRAGHGWRQGTVGRALCRADATNSAGEAFLTRRPVAVTDLRQLPHYELPPVHIRHGTVSTLDVPILGGHERGISTPFGVIEAGSPERRDFTATDADFLGAIAGILGEAIARAREHEALRLASQASADLAADRTVYLREIQHRVRNDLQLVHGLAACHSRKAEGSASRAGFDAIGRRVLCLAALYDHLLGIGMQHDVDFADYLTVLCNKIGEAEDLNARGIGLAVEAESLDLDMDTAAALGIVVNELVANAAEHAFVGGEGRVKVSLVRVNEDEAGSATLTIADNGCGFAGGAPGDGHGLRLVRRLVEHAGAELTRDEGPGTVWRIRIGR